jgi:hypothetical protein
MVVRKAISRQSGSWYSEVTSGPPLCVSIFAQEEFDSGAWFDALQAGMNAAISGMAAPVEICFAPESNRTQLSLRIHIPVKCDQTAKLGK